MQGMAAHAETRPNPTTGKSHVADLVVGRMDVLRRGGCAMLVFRLLDGNVGDGGRPEQVSQPVVGGKPDER